MDPFALSTGLPVNLPSWGTRDHVFTLQMRVRNLTRVLAYNLTTDFPPDGAERPVFFYTLHLTSKSAPFFTSDQATGLNPRWMEIDFKDKAGLFSSSKSLTLFAYFF